MLIWFPHHAGSFALHCWDDGAVVFNHLSGDTHQLGILAVELLHVLEQSPGISSTDLLQELGDVFSDSDSSGNLAIIDDALFQLEALGLIKRAEH